MQKIHVNTSHLEKVAKTIAVPRDAKPMRLPTYPALERTAVLSMTDTGVISMSGGAASYAVLCRNPAHPLWLSRPWPNTGSIGSIFIAKHTVDALSFAASSEVMVNFNDVRCSESVASGPFAGNDMPVVTIGDSEYWLFGGNAGTNGNTGLGFAFQASWSGSSPTLVSMQVEQIDFNGDTFVTQLAIGVTTVLGANVGFTWDVSTLERTFAWRPLNIQITNGAVAGVFSGVRIGMCTFNGVQVAAPLTSPSNSLAATVRLWPFSFVPAWSDSRLPYQSTRATAVACLFSNVTAVLNKEGVVEAARVPCKSFNVFDGPSWSFGTVHPRERYYGAMENGLYAFTMPDAPSEQMIDCVTNIGNTDATQRSLFSLDSFAYATVIKFSDLNAADGTNLAYTLDRHLEFRTNSILFPTDVSQESLETYHASQLALTKMGCLMENPIHLATVAKAAATAARAAGAVLWPIIQPHVMNAGRSLVNSAVNYANGKLGDFRQATMVKTNNKPARPAIKGKKVKVQRKK